MNEPDYTQYTLEELRDARSVIDVNQYAERAARLDLPGSDKEDTAKRRGDAPTPRSDHETANRSSSCARAGLGCVILLMGIYGLGMAALLIFAKSAFQDPEMLSTLQELPAFGDVSEEMIKLLPLRAALGGFASLAYCVAGIAVLLGSKRATLFVFVAAGLATARQLTEVGLALGTGGAVAFMAISSATVAIVVHVGISLAIYFTDPGQDP